MRNADEWRRHQSLSLLFCCCPLSLFRISLTLLQLVIVHVLIKPIKLLWGDSKVFLALALSLSACAPLTPFVFCTNVFFCNRRLPLLHIRSLVGNECKSRCLLTSIADKKSKEAQNQDELFDRYQPWMSSAEHWRSIDNDRMDKKNTDQDKRAEVWSFELSGGDRQKTDFLSISRANHVYWECHERIGSELPRMHAWAFRYFLPSSYTLLRKIEWLKVCLKQYPDSIDEFPGRRIQVFSF